MNRPGLSWAEFAHLVAGLLAVESRLHYALHPPTNEKAPGSGGI